MPQTSAISLRGLGRCADIESTTHRSHQNRVTIAKGGGCQLSLVRTRAEITSVALQMEIRPFNFDTLQKFPDTLDSILQHSRGIVIVDRHTATNLEPAFRASLSDFRSNTNRVCFERATLLVDKFNCVLLERNTE